MSHGVPGTYDKEHDKIVFAEKYGTAPHTWLVVKAVELLRHDGYVAQAELAEKHLLPMLEGATFCDVWGNSDYDGSQILHYYCPDRPDQNYGFGSDPPFVFKNASWDYERHPFYGYANSADYAQNRYNAAKRAYTSTWGSNRQDQMAGWVVDQWWGQEDPISGKWANGLSAINGQTRFGRGQTPSTALTDLLRNHSNSQVVFPDRIEPHLSRIFVPKKEVFDQKSEWLDEHFEEADDILAYCGNDGHGNAVYAVWDVETDSPMIVYLPGNSKEHAFFLLGWALHLVGDAGLPVHTIDSSVEFLQIHDDIEGYSWKICGGDVTWNGRRVCDALPALNLHDFMDLFQWPPPKGNRSGLDPAADFRERWYSGGSASDYVRNCALTAHKYMQFIRSINTGDDRNWPVMGHFEALALDLSIKASAGLILQFLTAVAKRKPSLAPWLSLLLCD